MSRSTEGSGATVGYLYPGIQAKGLKSITSPHPMVKDAATASSDSEGEVFPSFNPQGPGHSSFDDEDEVSASSDPKGPGPASSDIEDEVSALFDPQGLGHASSGPTRRAPPRPTPVGRILSRPTPRERFLPHLILGIRSATEPKQWS